MVFFFFCFSFCFNLFSLDYMLILCFFFFCIHIKKEEVLSSHPIITKSHNTRLRFYSSKRHKILFKVSSRCVLHSQKAIKLSPLHSVYARLLIEFLPFMLKSHKTVNCIFYVVVFAFVFSCFLVIAFYIFPVFLVLYLF